MTVYKIFCFFFNSFFVFFLRENNTLKCSVKDEGTFTVSFVN